MQGFKSAGHAQRFLSATDLLPNIPTRRICCPHRRTARDEESFPELGRYAGTERAA